MNDFILKFSFIAILFTAEIIFAAPKLNEALQGNDSSSILLSDTKDPKSAAIFSDTCATCHSGGVPRAPHSTTFQVMSPDYILSILNGVMAPQSEHLSEEVTEALAKKWTSLVTLVERKERMKEIAKDLVFYFNEKKVVFPQGKAMLCASSKMAAAKYFEYINKIPRLINFITNFF